MVYHSVHLLRTSQLSFFMTTAGADVTIRPVGTGSLLSGEALVAGPRELGGMLSGC